MSFFLWATPPSQGRREADQRGLAGVLLTQCPLVQLAHTGAGQGFDKADLLGHGPAGDMAFSHKAHHVLSQHFNGNFAGLGG